MRFRVAILLLLVVFGGCSGQSGKQFSIYFRPYSADLDPEAQATLQAAAAYAKAHPLMPLSIPGYASRPYSGNVDNLREVRVGVVLDGLVREGVGRMRIDVLGNGILYPDGVPNLPVGRVDINIGL